MSSNPIYGALNDSPMGALDPKSMALMQMGLQMMGQGPSRMPVSFGQSLGQAGQQGLQAFQQAQQSQQKQQLFQMQMAEQQRAEAARKQQEEAQAQLLQRPEFAQYAPLIKAGLPMSAVMDRAMPKPKEPEPFTLAPGAKRYGPDGRVIAEAPAPAEKPKVSDLALLTAERDALPQGHPNRPLYDAKILKLTSHAPAPSATASLTMGKPDSKYLETRLTGEAGDVAKLYSSAESAMRGNAALSRIAASNDDAYAGALAPLMSSAANVFASFGYDGKALKNTAAIQQASSEMLANRMSELGARGLTDKDMEILRDNMPKVNDSKSARRAVVGVLQKANNFTIQEAQRRRSEELTQYPELKGRTRNHAWEGYKVKDPAVEDWISRAMSRNMVSRSVALQEGKKLGKVPEDHE